MSKYKKWNAEEIEFIKNYHNELKDEELAVKLNEKFNISVTTSMIRRQRRKLSLAKKRGRPCKSNKLAVDQTNIIEPTVA